MTDLLVLTFDAPDEAARVRQAFRDLDENNAAEVKDSAVISRDAAGELHIDQEVSSGVKSGAVLGGALGLLMGVMFPPLGMALAAAGGAAAGAYMGHDLLGHVDKSFVEDVEAALTPGQSALFLLLGSANAAAVAAALRTHKGKLVQTTLDSETEETIRRALGEQI